MNLTSLTPADPPLSDFLSALTDAGLPVDDLTDEEQFFFVSKAGTYGGFALLGSHALLRSIVVPSSIRGTGEGRRVVEALCRQATERGASTAWLLTTGAADFFSSCSFEKTSRDDAPNAIRATKQFSGICPGSASLMRRSLVA